jgi:hypothetical protein
MVTLPGDSRECLLTTGLISVQSINCLLRERTMIRPCDPIQWLAFRIQRSERLFVIRQPPRPMLVLVLVTTSSNTTIKSENLDRMRRSIPSTPQAWIVAIKHAAPALRPQLMHAVPCQMQGWKCGVRFVLLAGCTCDVLLKLTVAYYLLLGSMYTPVEEEAMLSTFSIEQDWSHR